MPEVTRPKDIFEQREWPCPRLSRTQQHTICRARFSSLERVGFGDRSIYSRGTKQELLGTRTEAGWYLRLIDSCITQLEAQGPCRTCNESKEEDGPVPRRTPKPQTRNPKPETRNLKPET